MVTNLTAAPRRGRPRKTLSEVCPQRPMPKHLEVHRGHLRRAEEAYLERKRSELYFTNLHYEILREQKARENSGVLDTVAVHYPHIQAYRRMELMKRGAAAMDHLWALAATHHFHHLVLSVKSTFCRLHHARRLQDVRKYIWRRLGPFVTGFVRSLHVNDKDYPHWDQVFAVPAEFDVEFIKALRQLKSEIYGRKGPGDTRIWHKRIFHNRRHLERTIDYSLRARRFDRNPDHGWFAESFKSDAVGLAVGITRRKIIRCRTYLPPAQVVASPAPTRAPSKPGRPRKSDGKAYRQRRRRHSEPGLDAGSSKRG